MSRPTLRDVAAKAGLSVTQVSRALNDHDDVADSTKELARRCAAELKYVPNLEARRLKDPDARSSSIGIILPSESLRFSDPFFGDLLSAMVATASDSGYQLNLSTHPADTPVTEPYDLAIRRKQVDGFIVLRTVDGDPRIDHLLAAGVPFVTLGRPVGATGFASVEVAADCFEPVVDHLTDLGHRSVACLAEPSRFAMGTARLAAFRDAASRGGLVLGAGDVIEAGFHERAGHDAAAALFERADRPTAIVAMNDLLALGALDAAAEAGLSVPRDLTVIGFDDIRSAAQVRPALTTVRQPAAEVGAALVRLLVPAIEQGSGQQTSEWIRTSLAIRESSGRPADKRSRTKRVVS